MSIRLVEPLVTKGFGLKDEDLDEIIRMDRLHDISSVYKEELKQILTAFSCHCRIRLLEFDELSGCDEIDNAWYNALISGQRHIFYSHLHSNKGTCVVFLYSNRAREENTFRKRTLLHEFSHHYQWAIDDFPCLIPKGTPEFSSSVLEICLFRSFAGDRLLKQ